MATQITQTVNEETGRIVFRVEGVMVLEDAELIERLVRESRSAGEEVSIDLSDLDLLDGDAASVLVRLVDDIGVSVEGTEYFLQSAINSAERLAG